MVAAHAPASFASVSATITVICPPGYIQACPLPPMSISAEGVREYVPYVWPLSTFVDQTLLHSAWIVVPAMPDLILWAVGGAEIRSIVLPSGMWLSDPVQVTADEVDLGGYDNGATIDFEALIGASARQIRLGSIDLTQGTSFPLLVNMRSFDVTTFDGGYMLGNPGHLNAVATPEPSGSVLFGLGLLFLGARRRTG
ncbi:MAG TPA: PEP-CTERM sorting domain-containing protein [Myxococcota bacterium]